jgi:hypothetical protein
LGQRRQSQGISLEGCGLDEVIKSAKRARYGLTISMITPYVRLMNDGKTPFLGDFRDEVVRVVQKAAGAAYRAMIRPPKKMSIIDAAWQVMVSAYEAASANPDREPPHLPVKPRQIMYGARPRILELTGVESFGDSYFTQILLPDFIEENPNLCASWDIVWDARGHLTEPHTGRIVPLGTAEGRAYRRQKLLLGPAAELNTSVLYPTHGPANRYKNCLYIEKEGFDALLEAAQIAARHDMMIMSNKGMSVTATRELLDDLAPMFDNVFVLHDFDISGFTICGTLGTDDRRYTFRNKVPIVDLGLHLADAEAMGLQSEPVEVEGDPSARANTLRRHGANQREINFLLGRSGQPSRRIELNAMTSRQLIDFIERKFAEHNVTKLIPSQDVIKRHARRLEEQKLTEAALNKIRPRLAKQAAARELPGDLEEQIRRLLKERPELSWDMALTTILDG